MNVIVLKNADTCYYFDGFPEAKTASTLGNTMNEQLSDEKLMSMYQEGNEEAFNQLFLRHKDPVFRYLNRQCVTSVAEEIFQDVWLRLIQSKHQFDLQKNNRFAPYLYRIAHNRLMDYFRHNSVKMKVIPDKEPVEEAIEKPSIHEPATPEDYLDSHRKIERLLSIVDLLPEEQRQAFLLKEESGFSVQDIADVMGVSRETAKSRLRYAFQRIREGMRGLL